MKKLLVVTALLLMSNYAFSNNLTLANNRKVLVCNSSNLVKVEVNSERSFLRISQAGEFWGQDSISERRSDSRTFVSLHTRTGVLVFKSNEVFFEFTVTGETIQLDCR